MTDFNLEPITLYNGLGYCKLIDHMGDDREIVKAARMSTTGDNKSVTQDKKLLKYLFINRHTSPFEQVNLRFEIKCPMVVVWQLARHRTFSFNIFSGRYSEMPDECLIPCENEWRRQDDKNIQSSVADLDYWTNEEICGFSEDFRYSYSVAKSAYTKMLEKGVAREQARFVLPFTMITKLVCNVNLHNLMHFLRLRKDKRAQQEIRDLADAMYSQAKTLFPWTFELFDKYDTYIVEKELMETFKEMHDFITESSVLSDGFNKWRNSEKTFLSDPNDETFLININDESFKAGFKEGKKEGFYEAWDKADTFYRKY